MKHVTEDGHVLTEKNLILNKAAARSSPYIEKVTEIIHLVPLCELDLVEAERQTILAEKLSQSLAPLKANDKEKITSAPQPVLSGPIELPPFSSSNQFREALHRALQKVMEERDEVHARLVQAGVLHTHEKEQHVRKIRHLSSQLETMKRSGALNVPLFGLDKEKKDADEALRKLEREMKQDSDAELLSLCQQLAGEISARTSASLEIVRLKEMRNIEREHEAMQKKAMEEEILHLKHQLAHERRKATLARQESGKWEQSFKEVVLMKQEDTIAPQDHKTSDHSTSHSDPIV
jgi:hypothetical protein